MVFRQSFLIGVLSRLKARLFQTGRDEIIVSLQLLSSNKKVTSLITIAHTEAKGIEPLNGLKRQQFSKLCPRPCRTTSKYFYQERFNVLSKFLFFILAEPLPLLFVISEQHVSHLLCGCKLQLMFLVNPYGIIKSPKYGMVGFRLLKFDLRSV